VGHDVSENGYADHTGAPEVEVADLLLRLEQDGEVLGEWRLGDPPLRMRVVDPESGRVLATLAAEVPVAGPLADAVAATTAAATSAPDDEQTLVAVSDLLQERALEEPLASVYHEPTAELPILDGPPPLNVAIATEPPATEEIQERQDELGELNRINPDRMEASTTQDAPNIFLGEDTASAPRLFPHADLESVTAAISDLYREPTASLEELGLDPASDALSELSLDPPPPVRESLGGVDEVPVDLDDPGVLARHPGDDFTLPLPVLGDRTATGAMEGTGELGDSLTADLVEVEGRAEVWSRHAGEWVLKGTLVVGQRARMREGSVKCLQDGGLLVSPGPEMRGTADVPGADQVTMMPGEKPRRFPAGTAVTLWNGERALYVRSDQPMADVAPVEYHSGRSQSVVGYLPPKSDLESTGHGEI
jgi:hypothetical protein